MSPKIMLLSTNTNRRQGLEPAELEKKASPWDDGVVVEEPNDVLVDASHEGSPDDDHMLALSEEMVKTEGTR
jgi:hypothetical protein